MLKRMRKNEKLKISAMKDCSVARFRQNLLPLALELLSQPPSLSFFFSFRVPFIILGFMEGNLEVFGLFRAFSELYGPIWWSSAAALHVWRRGAAISGHLGAFWAHSGHLGTLQRRGAAFWALRRCTMALRRCLLALRTPETVSICAH